MKYLSRYVSTFFFIYMKFVIHNVIFSLIFTDSVQFRVRNWGSIRFHVLVTNNISLIFSGIKILGIVFLLQCSSKNRMINDCQYKLTLTMQELDRCVIKASMGSDVRWCKSSDIWVFHNPTLILTHKSRFLWKMRL